MIVTLSVQLDHHEGPRCYDRDVPWPMSLPEVGERVVLGRGLIASPVQSRLFVPDDERVILQFTAGPTDSVAWAERLPQAGYMQRG